ncbi:MAG: long-chain fatty acid--CoA ligase [Myxococcales bacterium]|nr:long-chain fatty acid--CoA ligase [Myxococcales bacterium]
MATFRSVAHLFRNRVESTPDLEAFSFRSNNDWESINWQQVDERVSPIAAGLRSFGIEDEQRVAVICTTRIEWLLIDIGINVAGAATTTLYPSCTAADCAFIVSDSASRIVFAENDEQVAKLQSVREEMPSVRHIINIDGAASDDGWVITIADLEARGAAWIAKHDKGLAEVQARLTPQHLCTLIYTSGTTGRPKGVELLHDCWLYTGEAIESTGLMGNDDRQFLWLPLSHSFGKMLETLAIYIGVPTSVDGDIPRIVDNLATVQPTFMAAAPRIFEKVYNKVVSGAQQQGGVKLMIFRWALKVGKQVSKELQAGRTPTGTIGLQYKLADRLVFSKLRELFGGRMRFFISGSAPLNRDIAEFFHAAGLLILEGYGLTESSAASFVNLPMHNEFGTVGQPLPGTQVKIADDGEILFTSRGIMRGYYNQPEKTAETLIDGRWLATGDIGEITATGHLRITDRKKDLIKTSGGKYVAPQALEGQFKAFCPYVSQILVHGNERNFCSALITMEPDAISAWADKNGMGDKSYAELAREPEVIALFQHCVSRLNDGLARFETIKRFALLEADFAIETGELTPSLKVKRKAVEAKYSDLLDSFYTASFAQI